MVFWIYSIYWLHWGLDILFAISCLSIILRPKLWARLYVTLFLVQQLALNGCIMSLLENTVEKHAGWSTSWNPFIMEYLFHGSIITAYKWLFMVVIAWQFYYITKEIVQWKNSKVT